MCGDDCQEPHLTPEGRRALIELLDREAHRLEVMRRNGWPLTTPRELIPAALGGTR